ncbi:MAG: 4-(cytidine 5'-diphospho)-2-C-methyl-D-erythritol kinase [Pirellulaceae bacterium]|nr:4-(cytidine 5'-diphospho)-2-C-methyl-D-erythritol kinase [Pirellulaceae bacterium]
MYVRQIGPRVIVQTPAKLNLLLEVLARRADGYHELETVMQAISPCDTLEFAPTAGTEITLACRWGWGLVSQGGEASAFGDLPVAEKNIVWRAVAKLRERAGITRGAAISLVKRIPSAAGLGGASSDAAAALMAANLGWRLGFSREQLAALAAEIGSDVPFFLTGGAAICRGRGERIEPLSRSVRLAAVVVRPPVGLATPEVFRHCRPADEPVPAAPLCRALATGQVAEVGKNLHNRLEEFAARLTPWIGRLRNEFARQGTLGHQMTGSGSSYFGLCHSARQARRVASRLRARRIGVVFAATSAITNNHLE